MTARESRGRRASLAAPALALLALVPLGPPESGAQSRSPLPNVATTLTLFAGTPAGLWRSRDWGRTWERVAGRSSGASLGDLGTAHSVLPLGTRVYLGGDHGLFLSDDFGESWTKGAETGPALCVLPSRYPQADLTVFLGSVGGLYKSEDGGKSFKPTALRGTPVIRLEWPGPALVVGTGRGVVVSEDAGRSFAGPGAGLPEREVRALALSSFYPVDPVLFAGGDLGGVFRSRNGGRTWQPAGLGAKRVNDLVWLGPFLYAAAEGGIYRSEDAGASWSLLSEDLGPRLPTRLLFPLAPAAGLEAFLGTDQGLFHTGDGGHHWEPSGLAGETILALATFPPPEPTYGRKPKR